jgi:hypothetical protein
MLTIHQEGDGFGKLSQGSQKDSMEFCKPSSPGWGHAVWHGCIANTASGLGTSSDDIGQCGERIPLSCGSSWLLPAADRGPQGGGEIIGDFVEKTLSNKPLSNRWTHVNTMSEHWFQIPKVQHRKRQGLSSFVCIPRMQREERVGGETHQLSFTPYLRYLDISCHPPRELILPTS